MTIKESSCQTNESEPWDGLTYFTMWVQLYLHISKKIT